MDKDKDPLFLIGAMAETITLESCIDLIFNDSTTSIQFSQGVKVTQYGGTQNDCAR
jgi:hypothetical protein